jgi:hypothetical protein
MIRSHDGYLVCGRSAYFAVSSDRAPSRLNADDRVRLRTGRLSVAVAIDLLGVAEFQPALPLLSRAVSADRATQLAQFVKSDLARMARTMLRSPTPAVPAGSAWVAAREYLPRSRRGSAADRGVNAF